MKAICVRKVGCTFWKTIEICSKLKILFLGSSPLLTISLQNFFFLNFSIFIVTCLLLQATVQTYLDIENKFHTSRYKYLKKPFTIIILSTVVNNLKSSCCSYNISFDSSNTSKLVSNPLIN